MKTHDAPIATAAANTRPAARPQMPPDGAAGRGRPFAREIGVDRLRTEKQKDGQNVEDRPPCSHQCGHERNHERDHECGHECGQECGYECGYGRPHPDDDAHAAFEAERAARYRRLSLLTLELAEEAGESAFNAAHFDRRIAAMSRAIWAHRTIERLRNGRTGGGTGGSTGRRIGSGRGVSKATANLAPASTPVASPMESPMATLMAIPMASPKGRAVAHIGLEQTATSPLESHARVAGVRAPALRRTTSFAQVAAPVFLSAPVSFSAPAFFSAITCRAMRVPDPPIALARTDFHNANRHIR